MQRLAMICFMLALGLAGGAGALADVRETAARAAEVLKLARAAVGGEEKIRGVRALTAKGKYRRVMGEREMSGERVFDFLLPDKFMREESFATPMGTSITTYRALDGAKSWSGGGGMGGNMFMMRNGSRADPTPEELAKMEQMQTRQMRAESARYLLAFMLTPPDNFPVEFSYAGEAEAEDGRADVLDATGPDGFSVRLFLDKATHLPLMLTYRAPKPRVVTMMQPRAGTEKKKPEEVLKEVREKAGGELGHAKPEEVEMQVRFSDYRRAGGLLLPHHITQGSEGGVSEEWEIKGFELNPQFKADKFQKK